MCICQLIIVIIYYLLLFIYRCCSFILFVVQFPFVLCSTFVLIQFFAFHFSLLKRRDSVLILDCIPGISILLFNNCTCCTRIPSPSMQVNKHHTSDCTDFVLVQEQVAYYNHRHSRINETNILQAVKNSQSSRERDTNVPSPFLFPLSPFYWGEGESAAHTQVWSISCGGGRGGVTTVQPVAVVCVSAVCFTRMSMMVIGLSLLLLRQRWRCLLYDVY